MRVSRPRVRLTDRTTSEFFALARPLPCYHICMWSPRDHLPLYIYLPASNSSKPYVCGSVLSSLHNQVVHGIHELMSSRRRRQSSQPPKAWTGTNPITQRASNPANMSNGSEKPLPRLPQQTQAKAGTNAHADKHAHDRLLYLLAHCTVSESNQTPISMRLYTRRGGG